MNKKQVNSLANITNQIRILYIKNLLIFQAPSIYQLIEGYINDSRRRGVEIGDLVVNPYIYNSRSLDVSFLISYIKSLNNLSEVLRNMYDEYLYDLTMKGAGGLYNNLYDFHIIFNSVNNVFNRYLVDQFLFEDFGIYQSKTSINTIMAMYESFNNYFVYTNKEKVDAFLLKKMVQTKSAKYLPYIYDKIFEQFEDIYLPFY